MNKKKLFSLMMGVCMVALLVACAAPTPAPAPAPAPAPPAKPIELKFANFFPPVAKMSTLGEDFIAEIDKRTNGRVKITYFPGGSLLGPADMYGGVEEGIADMGHSHIGYYRDLFLVTEVMTMPMGFTSGWVDNHVVNDFYDKFRPEEWDKVHVLWLSGTGPKIFYTAEKPIREMEDFKGLKIRGPGRAGDIIVALGGTPIPTPMPEAYEAVSKGVLDGLHLPFEPLKAWRMADITKYVTNSWQIGEIDVFWVIMNLDSWNRLPADIQKIFNETSEEFKEIYAEAWIELDFAGRDAAIEAGNELIELSPEEAARWVAAVQPVMDDYVKSMVDRGYSETEVRSWIKYTEERIEYWTKKQIELGIKSPTGPSELRP